MSTNEVLSVVAGGIITILVTIAIEALRRPRLRIVIADPVDANYEPGRPARLGRYLYVDLVNDHLPWFARWMSRSPALQCSGTITFHHLDGQRFFASHMPARFSRTPEPVPIQFSIGQQTGAIFDPSRISPETRTDVYPGERTPMDIAAKFDGEDDSYGWSNLNYFSNPQWRNPDWRLPRGRYLVSVTISSSGQKCRALFRLMNEAGARDFRLEPPIRGDKAT